MKSTHKILSFLCIVFGLLFFTSTVYSASIIQQKGKKVILKISKTDKIAEGDILYVVDQNKKKVDLVKVLQIKGDKAKGKLRSGRGKVGMNLMAKNSAKKTDKKEKPKKQENENLTVMTLQFGASMNTMEIQGLTESLSGSGSVVKATLDYSITQSIDIRGALGMFNFLAEAKCTSCKTNINYVLVGGTARYNFGGSFNVWLGLGYEALIPMSSDGTTALNKESITNTGILIPKLGFDYRWSPSMGIPFEVGYGIFPPSQDVNTSAIIVSLGLLFGF